MSQVNAQLVANCESEPEFEAIGIASSARKRKRLEEEKTFNNGVINLEATVTALAGGQREVAIT
jgi:hypothetical protein